MIYFIPKKNMLSSKSTKNTPLSKIVQYLQYEVYPFEDNSVWWSINRLRKIPKMLTAHNPP